METSWQEKIDAGQLVVIDGATGTELQKRGVPMDMIAWSGAAVLSHPQVVRETHEDYIRAGAEVVITNTFGSTRQMLEPAGFGDDVETVNRQAVQLAMDARDRAATAPVAIAGSISAMPPGFDRQQYWTPDKELESYREVAQVLAEAGVDLIALEMLEDTEHAARAMQAAIETGLPVWLGVSCRRNEDRNRIVSFAYSEIELTDVLDRLLPMGPSLVNIMHTAIDVIPEAIQLVRGCWTGPLGVYPESGFFTKPNWNFVDVVPPAELVKEAQAWVRGGVSLLGGCCGTGPEHISALSGALPALRAAKGT